MSRRDRSLGYVWYNLKDNNHMVHNVGVYHMQSIKSKFPSSPGYDDWMSARAWLAGECQKGKAWTAIEETQNEYLNQLASDCLDRQSQEDLAQ